MSKARTGALMCIHGGTTATVLVVLDGRRIVVANVGDSTAIVVGLGNAGTLRPASEWEPMPSKPAAAAAGAGGPDLGGAAASLASPALPSSIVAVPPTVTSSYMELSADHSPESPSEFARMHAFRPHGSLPYHPELLFVYDTLTSSKLSCPPIFEVDIRTGKAEKTERGSYYKNVRCEWATLVATPPHAPYQDALAFTRSLGDLHLQVRPRRRSRRPPVTLPLCPLSSPLARRTACRTPQRCGGWT